MALVREQARRDAESTLKDLWTAGHFPVNVEEIVERMGVRIEETFLREGVSGMLEVRPGETPTIYVDVREPAVRQRFTIAHELGHYVERMNSGHREFAFIDRRGATYDLHEFYADEFAGNLLMPQDAMERFRSEGLTVLEIAARFGVSASAVNKRIERLDRYADD